jgi:uncharacterized protein with FMN-binding domain
MTQKKVSGVLLVLTMLVLLISSCRKTSPSPNPEPQPVPNKGKLAKMSFKDGSYDSLVYNADGSVARIINHYTVPGSYTEEFSFEYNTDKKVSRINQNNGDYYRYEYVGAQLIAVMHYVNGKKQDYKMYDYDGAHISSIEEYYQPNPNVPGHELISRRDYSYYPDGNLKLEQNYSFDPVTRAPKKDFTVEHLDYDGKPNPADPLSRFLYTSFVEFAKNNARKMITRDEVNGVNTEFQSEYTYNASAHPLSRKVSYMSGGQLVIETIAYSYY